MINDKLVPFYNLGVGDFTTDFMDSLNWNQQDLADITGLSLNTINQLINNNLRITEETANLLEKAFRTPSYFWIKTDAKYQKRKLQEQQLDKNQLINSKAQELIQ